MLRDVKDVTAVKILHERWCLQGVCVCRLIPQRSILLSRLPSPQSGLWTSVTFSPYYVHRSQTVPIRCFVLQEFESHTFTFMVIVCSVCIYLASLFFYSHDGLSWVQCLHTPPWKPPQIARARWVRREKSLTDSLPLSQCPTNNIEALKMHSTFVSLGMWKNCQEI